MSHRTIQVVLDRAAAFEPTKRFWKLALFEENGNPAESGGGSGGGAEEVADLTLEAGWSSLGSSYEPPRRVKQGRLVTLVGIVMSIGPHGDGAVIGTLPEGWRPENTIICNGFGYITPGYDIRRWDIEPNGNVVLQGPLGDTDWMTLNATFLVPA